MTALIDQVIATSEGLTTPRTILALQETMSGDTGGGGIKGLVPAPGAGDALADKQLLANGSWGYSFYPALALAIAFGG